MRELPPSISEQPAVQDLLHEVAELRGQVHDRELAFRQAQERINDFERDWLYTSARNFRHRIARAKQLKTRLKSLGKSLIGAIGFIAAMALSPARLALRLVGIGRPRLRELRPDESRLQVGFTEKLPDTIVVGKGNSVVVGGWAFHPEKRIRHLELRIITARPAVAAGAPVDESDDPLADVDVATQPLEFDERLVPVMLRNIPNRQVLSDHFATVDGVGNSFWSGFFAELTLKPIARAARAQLVVRAYLDDGTVESHPLGQLTLQPALAEPPSLRHAPPGTGSLVAVCMTTYNPPIELFRKQIDSIRAQTHRHWVCYIRDDGSTAQSVAAIREVLGEDRRFVFRQNKTNLGFYKNFEAVLGDVPAEAEYVALSDQDDNWHPDKLQTLLGRFDAEKTLVYSDMNIVDEVGRVKSPTYWTTRDNNYTNFPTLLLANTITGAASLFRRSLLPYLLPFPEKFGDAYHDHWLAVTAMSLGKVGYVDRPLYDYVQHPRNVVGHVAPSQPTWVGAIYRFLAFFYPVKFRRNLNAFLRHGRGYFVCDLMRIQHTARNALVRCAAEAPPDRHAALQKVLTAPDSWSGLLWLALRPLRRPNSWRQTVGVESHLLQAVCWRAHLKFKAWWGTRLTARGLLKGVLARQTLPRPRVIQHVDTIAAMERVTAPLSLSVLPSSPRRVNLVVSIIDFKYVFGGYITVFHLARCLAERGFRVRLVVVDECDFRPVGWAQNFRCYPGLEDFLDRVELVYAFDRRTVVHVSPDDVFLATSWWTAHVAHKATQTLGKAKFVYLVQEFEPGFYQFGSLAAAAAESYTFPHFALFSTELLREYFRNHRHGVYARPDGDRLSESFENTITAVGEVKSEDVHKRKKRLLFYCRPEPHALRNMFDTGLMALRAAVARGAFAGWEFHGIGTLALQGNKLGLGGDVAMTLLPRHDQEAYRKILKDYDVGLSLMCSPHPSLVPLEMCSAGMLTVTNTFANKTADRLREISENFVPVAGTVDAVAQGLIDAEASLGDFDRRVRGAKVRWATDWPQSFHPALMHRLEQFLLAAMNDGELPDAAQCRAA